jgi:hypothetical protein
MSNRRWRPVMFLLLAVVAVWALALSGYAIAKSRRVTIEKIRAYV